jgi:hypothetical protein
MRRLFLATNVALSVVSARLSVLPKGGATQPYTIVMDLMILVAIALGYPWPSRQEPKGKSAPLIGLVSL